MWLDCDRPKTGGGGDRWLIQCGEHGAAYHYAIRKIKKDEESIAGLVPSARALPLRCWTTTIGIFGQKLNEYVAIKLA